MFFYYHFMLKLCLFLIIIFIMHVTQLYSVADIARNNNVTWIKSKTHGYVLSVANIRGCIVKRAFCARRGE